MKSIKIFHFVIKINLIHNFNFSIVHNINLQLELDFLSIALNLPIILTHNLPYINLNYLPYILKKFHYCLN